MKLSFYGGALTVTGANYLLETSKGARILVDCGMFQGGHETKGWNEKAFPYDPASIDAVVVTHAHLDHTGRLPKLVREGFRGPIYATAPTIDLARIVLEDSEHIMHGQHRQGGLCTAADVERTLQQCRPVEYHQPFSIGDASITLSNAGHILGSSSILVEADGKRVCITGDLGSGLNPLLPPADPLPAADYVLVESSYGGKRHLDRNERLVLLERFIKDTIRDQGVLLIPCFAIERTQEILYDFNTLIECDRCVRIPVFIDSPMAIEATEVYRRYTAYLSQEGQRKLRSGDSDLFHFSGLVLTRTKEESQAIAKVATPKIIIAGNGMSTGGRIIFHERDYLSDPRNTLLVVSYQVHGSLGRLLLEGEKRVMILGSSVSVNARVEVINSYSGHADQQGLLGMLKKIPSRPKHVWAVQGEPANAQALVDAVKEAIGIEASVAEYGEVAEL